MALQKRSSLSLLFLALALAGSGCAADTETGDGISPIIPGPVAPGPVGTTPDGGSVLPGPTGGSTVPPGGSTVAPGGSTVPPGGSTVPPGGSKVPPSNTPDTGVAVIVDAGLGSSDGGVAMTPADGGTVSADGGTGSGECCPDGNCLCHGMPPARLSAAKGPFKTASLRLATGTAYYPTDAQPPFAGIAICPGFTNTGPEMTDWGPFYASWGIVTVVTNTGGLDFPDVRATKLLASVDALKKENAKSGSPLFGKMSDRYGTSGYSMGGGGTVIASGQTPALKSSVALAPWGPNGRNVKVPSLLFCGSIDLVAPCSEADSAYAQIPNTTPKMKMVISGAEHLASWFGPDQGGNGTSGGYALAFNKVYLEGDTRWKSLLLAKPSGHEVTTNITP